MDNWNQMEQIEIISPKQKCLERALSLRVGVDEQSSQTRMDTDFFEIISCSWWPNDDQAIFVFRFFLMKNSISA